MKRTIALALLLAACGGSGSSDSSAATADGQGGETTGGESAGTIPRAAFIEAIATNTPGQVCGDANNPLRSCFAADEPECTRLFTEAVQSCAQELGDQIPDPVPDTPEAGQQYGQVIGQCAGLHYTAQMDRENRRRDSAECRPQQ